MRREQILWIAHQVLQFLLVTRVHYCLGAGIAQRLFVSMLIGSAYHHHIAIDSRAFELNHRAADRRHVAVYRSLNDDVAAQGNRAVFCGAVDSQRMTYGVDDGFGYTFDDVRTVAGYRLIRSLR